MSKIIARNREATYKYELLEKYEAGLSLLGWEVKAIKAGNVALTAAYAQFSPKGELFVSGMKINPLTVVIGSEKDHEQKLLLKASELKKIHTAVKQKGMTIVVYAIKVNPRGLIKLDIAIARGKKQGDRREEIKQRDVERQLKTKFKGM